MKQTTKAKILIVITLFVLFAVIYRTAGTINLITNGAQAQGTVLGHFCRPLHESTGSVQFLCTLKVSYLDNENIEYKFNTDILVREENYPKGTKVNVIYDKNDKFNANINAFKSLWIINILGFVFCAIFLGLAYLGLEVYRDEKS